MYERMTDKTIQPELTTIEHYIGEDSNMRIRQNIFAICFLKKMP